MPAAALARESERASGPPRRDEAPENGDRADAEPDAGDDAWATYFFYGNDLPKREELISEKNRKRVIYDSRRKNGCFFKAINQSTLG